MEFNFENPDLIFEFPGDKDEDFLLQFGRQLSVLLEAVHSGPDFSLDLSSSWAKSLLQLPEDVKNTSGLDLLGWITSWTGLKAKDIRRAS